MYTDMWDKCEPGGERKGNFWRLFTVLQLTQHYLPYLSDTAVWRG